jgi:hypothetical protein
LTRAPRGRDPGDRSPAHPQRLRVAHRRGSTPIGRSS